MLNRQFGFWTVKELIPNKIKGHYCYLCECICGKRQIIRKTFLINNRTNSCGCNGLHQVKGNRYERLITLTNGYLKNKRIWVDVQCDCGVIKSVLKQSLESGFTQSCGCLNKEILKSHCGSNHHNYNPNLTDEERKANDSRGSNSQYQLFRRKVLKKFNNTCICCGFNNEKNMRVHHLNSWNIDIDSRFDINNAVVLCPYCHDIQYENSFHFLYGNGNNTKEQFEQFFMFKNNQINVKQNTG